MTCPPLGIVARARVERVIDGDTLDVVLQLPVRVRLLDCWAPEMNSVGGSESKSELQRLLPVGMHVVVHVPTSDASRMGDVLTFGRVLGNVFREGESESISERMVANGRAKPNRD